MTPISLSLRSVLGTTLTLLTPPAFAAEDDQFSETIVVAGRRATEDAASFETRNGLDARDVSLIGAASADQIIRRLPGVHVPVNSRGEAIAFVRNAGERQVAVFYDGAAINVPWDNRLDLSLFPASLIGSVRTAAGPLAPHYGVNALGALSLSPRSTRHGLAALGSGDLAEGEAVGVLGPLVFGGSYTNRDGETLSKDSELPFSQVGRDLRTNTDRELASGFARIGGLADSHDLSLTAFHVWGRKGIASESNRASGARFWRYPDIRHTLVVGSATSALGTGTELNSAIWYQRFGQTIDNYANAAYDRTTLRQVDRDETWGVRELLKHRIGAATLVGSFNFLDSTHRQRDTPFTAANQPATLPPELTYSQRNWSVGAELEYEFSSVLRGEVGVGYDKVNYVRTGNKPPVEDATDWTGRAGLMYSTRGRWLVRAAAGRKMRAPTLRERFGEAINRFLINPDLEPERITTLEAGAEWRGNKGGFFVIPFVQDLKNTIDQRNVGQLRQRINLPGSKVQGLEIGGKWMLQEKLTVSGNTTWTRVRRKNPPAGQANRIAEKPSLLARARIDYTHRSGLSTALDVEHVGRAFSADPDGVLVPLERSTSLHWRLAYAFELNDKNFELFLNVENVTDTFIEPQLGLPGPGRSFRVGLRFD